MLRHVNYSSKVPQYASSFALGDPGKKGAQRESQKHHGGACHEHDRIAPRKAPTRWRGLDRGFSHQFDIDSESPLRR
jgi:hypothetical protein